MDLDISFLDKTMKTPVYVKMDAHEPLLLSEGVCRQMGIISYHPEVQPRKSIRNDSPEPVRKPESKEQSEKSPKCQVPTVRIQLVQSIKLPPNQTVMADVKLSENVTGKGPLLLEPDLAVYRERGVQIADSVVVPSEDGIARVMITNCLGTCMSQRAEMGMVVGIATPTEVIDPPKLDSASLLVKCSANPHSLDPSVVLRDSDQETVQRLTSTSKVARRKQQLCDLLNKEFSTKVASLPENQKKLLTSLLEEYHDVFTLEDGERGETDLVKLHIETGDASPIAQSVRRVPFAVRKEVARQLQEMQRNNVIQPSHSPWASPIVLVRKKDTL